MKRSIENEPVDTQENVNVQSDEGWISRVVRKRYGIAMILALVVWPSAGIFFEALLRNGMLIDSYRQLGFLAFVNVLACFFGIAIQRLLNSRHPGFVWHRLFGDGNQPWKKLGIAYTLGLAAFTPFLIAAFFAEDFSTSKPIHFLMSVTANTLGLASGWLLLFGVGWLKSWAMGSDETTHNFFPFEARNLPGIPIILSLRDRLINIGRRTKLDSVAKKLGLEPIDFQFLIYLAVLAAIHWGTSRWLTGEIEDTESWLISAPAMLVVLIWLGGMAFAGIANIFDRFRLPVVGIALGTLTVWLSYFGSTRDIKTFDDRSQNGFVKKIASVSQAESNFLADNQQLVESKAHVDLVRQQTSELEEAAWSAIAKRMNQVEPVDSKKGKTLVVVTCPGGGIHAAAWSACVLDRLSIEYPEFSDSICLISGVSGGSVGSLMFVSTQYDAELTESEQIVSLPPPDQEEIHNEIRTKSPALDLAARSSLEHIAYGVTTDDLYGLIFPSLAASGRGQRLEDSFAGRLPKHQRDLTLGDWGDRALEGSVPIVVFNSTDAVSGRRVLFDTIPTPRRASSVGSTSRPFNYRELMSVDDGQARDVKPATAVRTSATFPYVSPFTKPDYASLHGDAVAICDGGYVDNEGIVTAVNWIEFILRRWAVLEPNERPFDRILLLRIEPARSEDLGEPSKSGGLAGWLRWIAGPAETIANVRSASQLERGNLESDLAALYLELNTGSAGGDEITSAKRLPPTLLESPLQQTKRFSMADANESSPQRQESDRKINRKEWGELVEKMQANLRESKSNTWELPRMRAIYRPALDDEFQPEASDKIARLPVVIATVRFEDADQVIPLNWKLSKKQKAGYLVAWQLAISEGTVLRTTMERFFTRIITEED